MLTEAVFIYNNIDFIITYINKKLITFETNILVEIVFIMKINKIMSYLLKYNAFLIVYCQKT
jgi:hypothetical protein